MDTPTMPISKVVLSGVWTMDGIGTPVLIVQRSTPFIEHSLDSWTVDKPSYGQGTFLMESRFVVAYAFRIGIGGTVRTVATTVCVVHEKALFVKKQVVLPLVRNNYESNNI